MVEVKVRACDVCSRVQGVVEIVRYELKVDGQQRIVTDLCEDHAAPLLEVVDSLPKSVKTGRKRRTMEQSAVLPDDD